MKRILRLVMLFSTIFPILVYSENSVAEDLSQLSVIQNTFIPGREDTRFSHIDDETFWFPSRDNKKNIAPGAHQIHLTPGYIKGGRISFGAATNITCTTEAGYVYTVNANGCLKNGRRMDFEGAKEYWDKFDEDKNQKAVIAEAAKYQSDKLALSNAKSKNDILNVISSVEQKLQRGINRDDPDDLLGQAKQRLAPYLQAEADARDRDRATREKEAAERARILADRQQKELQQAVSFRKTLAQGDETNCGLVIEKKAKLVKIQIKSTNAETWVRLDEIYPVGQSCSIAAANTSSSVATPKGVSTVPASLPVPTHGCRAFRNDQIEKMDNFISQFESNCRATGGRVTHGDLQFQCLLRVTAYLIYFKRDDLCAVHAMNKSSDEEHEIAQTRGWFD